MALPAPLSPAPKCVQKVISLIYLYNEGQLPFEMAVEVVCFKRPSQRCQGTKTQRLSSLPKVQLPGEESRSPHTLCMKVVCKTVLRGAFLE